MTPQDDHNYNAPSPEELFSLADILAEYGSGAEKKTGRHVDPPGKAAPKEPEKEEKGTKTEPDVPEKPMPPIPPKPAPVAPQKPKPAPVSPVKPEPKPKTYCNRSICWRRWIISWI